MTAQIADTLNLDDKKYSIIRIKPSIGFDPAAFGFKPKMINTACWRGYWCEYKIIESSLFLDVLNISNEGECPEFCGKNPIPPIPETMFGDYSMYENLNLRMEYSGRMLLGNGFISEHYIHMGYQHPWAYEELYEFVFSNGKVVERTDYSESAKKLRKTYRPRT